MPSASDNIKQALMLEDIRKIFVELVARRGKWSFRSDLRKSKGHDKRPFKLLIPLP
jgi:hypothetical protein